MRISAHVLILVFIVISVLFSMIVSWLLQTPSRRLNADLESEGQSTLRLHSPAVASYARGPVSIRARGSTFVALGGGSTQVQLLLKGEEAARIGTELDASTEGLPRYIEATGATLNVKEQQGVENLIFVDDSGLVAFRRFGVGGLQYVSENPGIFQLFAATADSAYSSVNLEGRVVPDIALSSHESDLRFRSITGDADPISNAYFDLKASSSSQTQYEYEGPYSCAYPSQHAATWAYFSDLTDVRWSGPVSDLEIGGYHGTVSIGEVVTSLIPSEALELKLDDGYLSLDGEDIRVQGTVTRAVVLSEPSGSSGIHPNAFDPDPDDSASPCGLGVVDSESIMPSRFTGSGSLRDVLGLVVGFALGLAFFVTDRAWPHASLRSR